MTNSYYCVWYNYFVNTLKGARSYSIHPFVQGSGPIHMDNVRCTGAEMSLIDCPHSRSHSCSHHDDAAVQCQTSKVNQ